MATARDEHAKQTEAPGIHNDTELMEPSFEQGPRMTGKGQIPGVEDEFATPGPTASDLAYGSYVQVTASTLNVRSGPSKSAPKVGKLPNGAKVEVRGRDGDWVKISFGGGTGFVHGNYVKPIDTRPSAESSAEVMKLFREVNGDDLMEPSFDQGKPTTTTTSSTATSTTSKGNDTDLMQPSFGQGKPPSPERSAENMKDFWEVNGGPPVKKDILDDLE